MSDEMDKFRKKIVREAKEKEIQEKRLDAEEKVMREWRVKNRKAEREFIAGAWPERQRPSVKRTIGKKAAAIKKAVTTAGGILGKAISTATKQVPKAAKAAGKPDQVRVRFPAKKKPAKKKPKTGLRRAIRAGRPSRKKTKSDLIRSISKNPFHNPTATGRGVAAAKKKAKK